MNKNEIKNRSEILFLYDIKDANPNGDPLEENKPRIDEETGRNIVTDVRLKRTIRDYFLIQIKEKDERLKDQDVFVKEVRDDEGYLYDAKKRAENFLGKKSEKEKFSEKKKLIQDNLRKDCIDVRLFGAVVPLEFKIKGKEEPEKGSITLIGPVQFKLGRSLHSVEIKFIKGTGAFASTYTAEQKSMQFTFREEYILPYSLISFYGIINENAAKETDLKENDVDLLLDGIWNGTKNLITRSKIGQVPRFLLRVIYKERNYHIGGLDGKIKLGPLDKRETNIRDISEVKVDVTNLINTLESNKKKIDKIEYEVDESIVFLLDGEEIKGSEIEGKLKKKLELEEIKNLNLSKK